MNKIARSIFISDKTEKCKTTISSVEQNRIYYDIEQN